MGLLFIREQVLELIIVHPQHHGGLDPVVLDRGVNRDRLIIFKLVSVLIQSYLPSKQKMVWKQNIKPRNLKILLQHLHPLSLLSHHLRNLQVLNVTFKQQVELASFLSLLGLLD